jgi:Spy/CpxP family protein refolding chaperone
MKAIRTLALILAMGAAAPTLVWAQAGPPPTQERPMDRPMKRELPPEAQELLKRQREEMRAMRKKHMEERRALRQKLHQERKEQGFPPAPPEKKSL